MEIHTNIPIKNFTTMRLGGNAKFIAEIFSAEDIKKVHEEAKSKNLPIFVLGDGSNVIAHDNGFDGIIAHIKIAGFTVVSDDVDSMTIKVGAGENWDSVVKRVVDMNLSGIETMSAIPGTIGATPVQNVGAYGQEIADTLQSLEAYDTKTEKFVILRNTDCNFSYRNSIFRNEATGRYIISSITLKLSKKSPQPPFYDSLQKYLNEKNITFFTSDIIRDIVIEIRKNKLPDPKVMASSGSFFKNAIIEDWQLTDLLKKYPDMPKYEMGDGTYKIPTGWLIEKADLKGQLINGMRVYDKNALVLVNESANSYNDLANARNEIITKVRDKFGIQIQQEPLEI